MRNYIDVVETILYRGDANEIAKFSFGSTEHGLFGRGIYLTDNPQIAKDYTVKGGTTVFVAEKARNQKDAVAQYIKDIISKRLADKARWPDKYSIAHDLGFDPYSLTPEQRTEVIAMATDLWNKTVKKLTDEAVAIFKSERDDLSIFRDTTGAWNFVRSKGGHISTFDIPDDYLARCLHGDDPLPDELLSVIRDLIYGALNRSPSDKLDMRNRKHEYLNFDEWVKAFRTTGIHYAWDDEGVHDRGGKGRNPSLDTIINGTHAGFQWFYSHYNAFIKAMMDLGYVGIEYNGGTRVGAHTRGGGGVTHHAYVLWDEAAVNKFRVASEHSPFADIDANAAQGLMKRKGYTKTFDSSPDYF